MKYYIDCEFIEGFVPQRIFGMRIPKWLSRPHHTIQLISIAIVADDGREYYAISNEFKREDASPWVKENVIDKLPARFSRLLVPAADYSGMENADMWGVQDENPLYKSNAHIAKEIINFVNPIVSTMGDQLTALPNAEKFTFHHRQYDPWTVHEFYGYYCDYDWVLLCSLFGTMMQLPQGFPMYCRDLKQTMDEQIKLWVPYGNTHDKDLRDCFRIYRGYPASPETHNALDDARWIKTLHTALQQPLQTY